VTIKHLDYIELIEINPTELCNLKCSFCPRSTFYPNQNLHMSLETAREIRKQLDEIKFTGEVSITGRGEPTLHQYFEELSEIFLENRTWTLKINTNGKRLNEYVETIWQYDKITYNLYDHTEAQVKEIKDFYKKYKDKVTVYHKPIDMRWYEKSDQFTFTNRGGSFPTNHLPSYGKCDTIFLKIWIDWDGTYRLCCHDWKEKISMGNIFDQSIKEYVENNPMLQEYRLKLMKGDRSKSPCNSCSYNMDGRSRKDRFERIIKDLIQ